MQAVEDQAARLWDWGMRHLVWSFIILIVLFVCMWLSLSWTLDQVRFGPRPSIGHNCGGVGHFAIQYARADKLLQPLDCFWQAYQTCDQAAISLPSMYIDELIQEERGDHCAMYGQQTSYDQAHGAKHRVFLCNQLSKVGETLEVSDCDGIQPFVLSPRTLPADSYPCGVVGATSHTSPQKIEQCFFEGYHQCFTVATGYKTMIDAQPVESDFYIDTHCQIAYLRGTYTATCAGLESRADGLHFLQCGTDGNIFVPIDPPSL